mmetsp:Transcript_79859/g.231796  ORF Transcript_79859/g.231796 Transcript_79859/m.231796 type:complete len:597 (-) Transcript_79859:21-1811(-)
MFRGCRPQCSPCGAFDTPLGDTPIKVKLCSWAEEEVDFEPQHAHRHLGFFGKVASVPVVDESVRSSSSSSAATSAASSVDGPPPSSALYRHGGLVPVRGLSTRRKQPFSDTYTFDSEALGRGSYGEVLGATHRRTGARRAVKVVGKVALSRYVDDAGAFVRREVDILRRLDHPNIVRMYEAYEDEQNIYIVLELCNGGDLLERVTAGRDRMPERVAASLLTQMMSALQHMWLRGIVHRDLKPENFLFLHREPEREPLPPASAPMKLIDFGLSRRLTDSGTTVAGARVTPKIGTAEYMAPEAFVGKTRPALADRMDVWSLGVVLHVIFIGHFPSPRIAELSMEEYLALPCWKSISPAGREMMGLLLRSDPSRRPSVTDALRHPWIMAASEAHCEPALRLARILPSAVQAHMRSPSLRRMALGAIAREVDEVGLRHLRDIFYSLQAACGGNMTRPALSRASANQPQPLAALAAELDRRFAFIDMDGSGSIEWSELVAVIVGSASDSALRGIVPALTDQTCLRAFDLLSQGTLSISAMSLGHLFLTEESSQRIARNDTIGTFNIEITQPRNIEDLEQMVDEVDVAGHVDAPSFLALIRE